MGINQRLPKAKDQSYFGGSGRFCKQTEECVGNLNAEKTGGKKIYFGWLIVATSFALMILSFTPNATLSAHFVKPLAEAFGISRTMSTSMNMAGTIVAMLTSLVAGGILARFSIRTLVTAGLIVQAVTFFLCMWVNSFPLLFALALIRGAANCLTTVLPITMLLNNWFGSKMRGKVWGFIGAGSGVGAMILNPVTAYILENWGWRMGYVVFGIFSLVLVPPVLLTFLRNPKDKGLEIIGEPKAADGQAPRLDTSGIEAPDALRTGMFWVLIAAIVLVSGGVQVWNLNGASYLTDRGFAPLHASFLLSIGAVSMMVGKVTVGAISDKWGSRMGVSVGAAFLFVGYFLAVGIPSVPFIEYPAVVLLGFGLATSTIAVPLMTRDLFGNRAYGTLNGITQSALSLGSGLMPWGAAFIFDNTGSYVPAWIITSIGCAVSVALFFVTFAMRKRTWDKFAQYT